MNGKHITSTVAFREDMSTEHLLWSRAGRQQGLGHLGHNYLTN